MSKYQITDGDFSIEIEGWMSCREVLFERYGEKEAVADALKSGNVTVCKIDDVTKDACSSILLLEEVI